MAARLPPPGGVSYKYDLRFIRPVYFGDTVTAELRLAEMRPDRRELVFAAQCANQHGATVLEGQMVLKLI
jgi:3-hydroxybutyryl-CoA dehydratase